MNDKEYLNLSGRLALAGNKWLNRIIALFMALVVFISGYALYDAWRVIHDAGEGLKKYKPSDTMSLEDLMAINPDVCAWLTVDDTNIDYPVLRGQDNEEYLTKDFYGEYAPGGSLFLDFRNSREFDDYYHIIYGHHMNGGAMFGDIPKFESKDFFDSHTTGTLMIPGITYQLEIFAYLSVDAYDSYMFVPILKDEESGEEVLTHIQQTALNYRDIGVTGNDRIMAMSTCSEAFTDARSILVARIVQPAQ